MQCARSPKAGFSVVIGSRAALQERVVGAAAASPTTSSRKAKTGRKERLAGRVLAVRRHPPYVLALASAPYPSQAWPGCSAQPSAAGSAQPPAGCSAQPPAGCWSQLSAASDDQYPSACWPSAACAFQLASACWPSAACDVQLPSACWPSAACDVQLPSACWPHCPQLCWSQPCSSNSSSRSFSGICCCVWLSTWTSGPASFASLSVRKVMA
mmetsp:Transcript_95767/g.298250  ORF Transcript_95767/g.298250 Transcript_95767/m.298250 type:complete len:212 (+) Transcript_95767:232-867(+)